jgi:hypothetical protein
LVYIHSHSSGLAPRAGKALLGLSLGISVYDGLDSRYTLL